MRQRVRRFRLIGVACGIAVAAASAGCGDTAQAPTAPAAEPAVVAAATSPLSFKIIGTGDFSGCGVTTDNRAFCWGLNEDGQLGDGTRVSHSRPAEVVGGRRYRQLRTGGHHACAVTFGDVVYCWGDNGVGQLGAVTEGLQQSNVPLEVVTGGPVFHRVFPGGAHTCALTSGNVAYCWGDNSVGELGTGSHTSSITPVRVSGTRTFNQMSAGLNHVCGVSAGKAYCWGANFEGALGDGTQTERTVPTAVAGGLTFKGVSAAFDQTCGITSVNRAYCWGANFRGQLGIGISTKRSTRPVPVQ